MPVLFVDIGSGIVQYLESVAAKSSLGGVFYSRRPTAVSKLKRLNAAMAGAAPGGHVSSVARQDVDTVLGASSEAGLMPATSAERLARSALLEIGSILDSQDVDGVFLWNGSGLVATAAVHLARVRGLPTVFGENGYFPGTLQVDSKGVNQLSSITGRVAEEYAMVTPSLQEVEAYEFIKDVYLTGKSPSYLSPEKKARASLASKFQEKLWKVMNGGRLVNWSARLNKEIPSRLTADVGEFVLLPLQVVKDSQLLRHSPLFGNDMPRFIRAVRDVIRGLGDDVRLVVKIHPAERQMDYSMLSRELPDVLFVAGMDIRELISQARAIVTINSTVGFEGLIHGKGVVMAGENFYRVEGVVHAVDDLPGLQDALRAAMEGAPDLGAVHNFLVNCYANYFVKGTWKDFSNSSLVNVASKIDEIVDFQPGG